ncbi:hypothetical protein DH2020_033746 [Rehmannia glutinosa]|uniref:Trichome birefringence-like N-terminal domain-containing protein n=1 Tax=Rehmannia glutinosa TaxID=99300 RepID=A0ABR0VES0_REHGL
MGLRLYFSLGQLLALLLSLSSTPFLLLVAEQLEKPSNNRCDIFEGSWVFDNSYPLYDASQCPFIDSALNCQNNGRPDTLYLHYKWKPIGCDISRFDGEEFLERNRGKKVMFVGDSLSNNQWQSLGCMLHAAVPNANYTLTSRGRITTLFFLEYGVSVMFLKNGFLVSLENRTLRLDTLSGSEEWKGVDVLIFNSYHWWLHTGRLRTGAEWNEPGVQDCRGQTKPVEGSNYPGTKPPGDAVVKSVVSNMKRPAILLDIVLLTQLRKDGHPSTYAGGGLDCSHWCLAGVPDTWNQLLYTILLQN